MRILTAAGMTVLDEQATIIQGVGFAGVKGFIGGFNRGELGAFGEAAIKTFVDELINEARKLENQLRTLRTDRAVAILHYSPVADTVAGEPEPIYPFPRLLAPRQRGRPVRECESGGPRPRAPRHLSGRDPARRPGL